MNDSDPASRRSDALAWECLAHTPSPTVRDACLRELARRQEQDGRVPMLPASSPVAWTTSAALLAWQGESGYEAAAVRARAFLLRDQALLFKKSRVMTDNSSVPAWGWLTGTAPWVFPTAIALLALQAWPGPDRNRVEQGQRYLLSRQLPEGGWTLGNRQVYGSFLRPAPEFAGAALLALRGLVSRNEVAASLQWAASETQRAYGPWGLSWLVLALAARQEESEPARARLPDILAQARSLGVVDDACQALATLALKPDGWKKLLPQIATSP